MHLTLEWCTAISPIRLVIHGLWIRAQSVNHLKIPQEILLIDVREPDEVKLGSIPSAVNLPLSVLRKALDPDMSDGEFKQVGFRSLVIFTPKCPAQENPPWSFVFVAEYSRLRVS